MSYDLYLKCSCCGTLLFHADPTYNLSQFFKFALNNESLYVLNGLSGATAAQRLNAAVDKVESESPEALKRFDAPNGWGTAEGGHSVLKKFLSACREHPDAIVKIS